MKFDEALGRSNPLGRTQFVVAFSSCLMTAVSSWINLSNVFVAEVPDFHCSASSWGSLNETIPLEDDGTFSRCLQFVRPSKDSAVMETEKCSNGWDYDTELFGNSIVSEFDLVCDKSPLPDLDQSLIVAGLGVGSTLAGPIADHWGRRPTFMTSLLIFNVIGVSISFSTNYIMFVVLRFLFAVTHVGCWLPSIIALFEYLTPKHRATVGNIPALFFTFGLMLMSPMGYFIRDWRWFLRSMMVPTIIATPFTWLFPESVRWLLSVKKHNQAEKAMQKVARRNRASDIPERFFEDENTTIEKELKDKIKPIKILDLFKPPILTVTLILGLSWFSFFLVYFGFALSTGSLAGDLYLNFFISTLFELPARLIPIWLLDRIGSVIPCSACFALGGLMMVGMLILKAGTIGFTICALFGRFFITFNFSPILLLTSDLYPTSIRNIGTGIVQLIGRLGSVLSPFLLYLDEIYPNLAFTSMAFMSGLTAVLVFVLPETLHTVQPTTKDDLRELMDGRRIITLKNGCRMPIPSAKPSGRSNREDATAPSISGVVATNGGVSPTQERFDNLDKAGGEKNHNVKYGNDNYAYDNTNV